MKTNLGFLIFNFLGLQATWAACAFGATKGMPMLGVYIGFAYIAAHFILSQHRLRDLKVMLIIGIAGIIIDSVLSQLNYLSFPGFFNQLLTIPFWLISLWFVFSLMLPYSLYWLIKNLKLAAIAGAIGGSFSYFLGHKLGALQLNDPLTLTVFIYFIIWGIIFPSSLLLVRRLSNTSSKQ